MKNVTLKVAAVTLLLAASLPAHSAVWRSLNPNLHHSGSFHETSPHALPIQRAYWLAPDKTDDPAPHGKDALGELLGPEPQTIWIKNPS